ncbi:MAG: PDZ domain-containing protein [Longimicrobiales bacterium]
MRRHGILLALFTLALSASALANAQEGPPGVYRFVQRGTLGISFQPVPANAMTARRQLVVAVAAESPAAKAGVAKGDTIVSINGLAASTHVLSAPFEPGDTVVLRVSRNGRERDIPMVAAARAAYFQYALPDSVYERMSVMIGRMRAGADTIHVHGVPGFEFRRFDGDSTHGFVIGADSSFKFRTHRLAPGFEIFTDSAHTYFQGGRLPRMFGDSGDIRIFSPGTGRTFMYGAPPDSLVRGMQILATNAAFGMRAVAGAEMTSLNADLAEYFGVTDGVLVLNAHAGTPAARAGLRGGDVIQRVGDMPVRSISELRSAIERAHGGDVMLRVLRRGRNVDVTLSR